MMLLTVRDAPDLQTARVRLQSRAKPGAHLSALGAAAALASSTLALAAAVILGPPDLGRAANAVGLAGVIATASGLR